MRVTHWNFEVIQKSERLFSTAHTISRNCLVSPCRSQPNPFRDATGRLFGRCAWQSMMMVMVMPIKIKLSLFLSRDYKEEHWDFIQLHIRRFCLQFGAALFYTSVKEDKNCDLLYKYLAHRIYGMQFRTPALVVEKDAVFM